jgi:uncharacterized membrane protein
LRLLRHRWLDDAGLSVSKEMTHRLAQHIAASELRHTGEVRMCIEGGLPNSYLLRGDPISRISRQRAVEQFSQLRVWDTADNNGVLIYLLLAERTIEIVADRGLNERVSADQWSSIVRKLSVALKDEQFEAGLLSALDEVSAILCAHFPAGAKSHNPNELPDQPVLL